MVLGGGVAGMRVVQCEVGSKSKLSKGSKHEPSESRNRLASGPAHYMIFITIYNII